MSADGSSQLTIHGKRRELADGDIREESPARRPRLDEESSRMGNDYKNNTGQGSSRNVFGNYTNTNNAQYVINVGPQQPAPIPPPQASSQAKEDEAAKALIKLLSFEQMDNRFANIKDAHHKSCEWLFKRDEYNQWRDPKSLPQHHGFFWIKGKPGAGKSTLMKVAQVHGEECFDDMVISFYFNARATGDLLQNSTQGMYRSLLVQILEQVPQVSSILSARRGLVQNGQDWPLPLLEGMFRDAVLALGSTPLTCYVDALDECEDSDAIDMVEFFERLGERAVGAGVCFHVLLSSRHYPEIEITRCVQMTLEGQEGHEADIADYVRSNLKITESVASGIHEDIQSRASGVFLWVVLVVRILNKLKYRGKAHLLQRRLNELPDDLHQLFQGILERGEHDKKDLLLTLQWLLFAQRPLTPKELYFAVATDSSDESIQNWDWASKEATTLDNIEKFVRDSSKGLAEITKGHYPIVQFIHESVRDFLLEKNGLKILDSDLGSNTAALCHDRLKRCSLHYMSYCEPDLLSSPTDGMRDHFPGSVNEGRKIRRRIRATHPFLGYALEGIVYHADSADRDLPQHEFIANFPRTLWHRLYNLTVTEVEDRLSQGVPTVYIFILKQGHNLVEHLCLHDGNFASADVTHEQHKSLLGAAVDRRDNQMVDILLAHGADPNSQAKEGQSCLVLATRYRRKDLMCKLLGAGATPTPMETKEILELAFSHGDIDMLRMLVTHANVTKHLLQEGTGNGSDTRDLNEQAIVQLALNGVDGASALTKAASSGNDKLMGLLLACGVSVDSRDSESSDTALQCAAWEGHEQVVRLRLDRGADTALQCAAWEGHEQVVRLLLDRGADVNLSDREGETALHNAARRGHEQVVGLLLDHGADVNLSDNKGDTALQYAAEMCPEQVVRLLLDHGADVNLSDNKGDTALQYAAMGGNVQTVSLLLDHGVADINAENSRGESALSLASCYCNLPVVSFLLDHGAEAERVYRPFSYMGTQEERNEIERLVLAKGATVIDAE